MTAQPAVLPPRPAPLDTFWRAARSRMVSLLLVVLVGLSLVLGNLVPQLPPEAAESTASRARWFANAVSSLGSLGTPLRALGFLDIAHAPWWRILLALCFFHLSLILADEGRRAWRLSRRLPLSFPAHFLSLRGSPDFSTSRERASRALSAHQGPVATTEQDGAVILCAARRPRAAWARPLVCAGLLCILAWLLMGERFSWRDARLVLPPGEAVALTQALPWELRLADENPPRLAFVNGSLVMAEQALAVGSPARYRGINVHLLGGGPALIVRGHKADGQPLTLQSITTGKPATHTLALAFDQPYAERTFAVPAQRVAFRLLASPDNPLQVEVYHSDSDTPFLRTTVTGTSTIEVEGARYDFTPARYLLLTAVHEPVLPLATLGGILLLAGILAGFLFPARVAWVRLWPDAPGTGLEVAVEHLGWIAGDEHEVRQLARTLADHTDGG